MAVEHKNIANVDLHEPKDINSAPTDTVYTSNGAGSGTWQPSGVTTLDGLTDVDTPTPSEGERLTWDGQDNLWKSELSTSALGIVQFSYKMSLPATPTPSSKFVSRDTADPLTSTVIYMNRIDDAGGTDLTLFLEGIDSGDWLNLHLKSDASIEESYDVIGPAVLVGDVFEIPVVTFESVGTLQDDDRIRVFYRKITDSTGIPEAPIDGLTYGRKDAAWVTVAAGQAGVLQTDRLEARDFTNQNPPAMGIAAIEQIKFGPAQTDLAADGTYTVANDGDKTLSVELNAQRNSNGGEAMLWVIAEVNGVAVGSNVIIIDNNKMRISYTFTVSDYYQAGDDIQFFMYRTDENDGGLYAVTNPDNSDYDAPSAKLIVTELDIV